MEDNRTQSQKHRTKSRFNILDAILIILLVFIVAIAVLLTLPIFNEKIMSGEKVVISYTLVFDNFDDSVYSIVVDQNVTDVETGRVIGRVALTPESIPHYDFVLTTNEAEEEYAVKHLYGDMGKQVTVTVIGTANYKEGLGYYIDGSRIAIGRKMKLRFANYTGECYCNDVAVIG